MPHPTNGWQRLGLGILYVLLPILVLIVLYYVDRPELPPAETRVSPEEALMVASLSKTPPRSGWHELAGTRFRRVKMEPYNSVWFRIPVTVREEQQGLYVPTARGNLTLFVDDQQFYESAPISSPLPYFRSPLLARLPPPGRLVDAEFIYVNIVRESDSLFPPETFIGVYDELVPAFEDRLFAVRWLPIIVVSLTIPLMLILGGMYVFGRRESAYGWYSLTLLLWGLHTIHALVDKIPFHYNTWFILNYLMLTWVVTEIIFINRFFDFRTPRLEKALFAVTGTLSAAFFVVGLAGPASTATIYAQYVFTPWTMLCVAYVTALYFVALVKRWSMESVMLWLASSVFLGIAIRDWLYEFAWWMFIPGSIYYLQFAVLLPFGIFAALLVRRHVAALNTSETLNAELEDRVAEKAAALETSYQQLAGEEKRRTIAEERARLTRDMHDGLGGQLVHAIGLSERAGDQDLSQALRSALSDLRLIIDSMSPEERSLPALLAAYRHRTTKAIRRQGIPVHWDLDELPEDIELSPDRSLGLMRIVQEAVTNAVRHSRCKQLEISARTDDGILKVAIADDGIGLGEHTPGRGLRNMKIRAQEIGGEIRFRSDESGTTVECSIQLNTPAL